MDDFLIQESTLERRWHQPEYSKDNPVIKPETKVENSGPAPFAGPFSGGVWYDGHDRIFKIWYTCGYLRATCYATSNDGIHWNRPNLDVVPGTNIVLEPLKDLKPAGNPKLQQQRETRPFDTNSIWIDYKDDPERRYKIFYTSWPNEGDMGQWHLYYKFSKDGIHWSQAPVAASGAVGDHTNAFYNPFRDKWVIPVRYNDRGQGRARAYVENSDPAKATTMAGPLREMKWCRGWLQTSWIRTIPIRIALILRLSFTSSTPSPTRV